MHSSSNPSTPVSRGMELSRSGWLEKYSVGRGFIPVRNWQKRWFTVTHDGLNYSKTPDVRGDGRTYIPFIATEGLQEMRMTPVFLFTHITESVHPAANDPNYFYFGVRFEEKSKPHVLLLRSSNFKEKDQWVHFISQFVHVGTNRGIPTLHPLDSASPRTFDPEELDPSEKRALKRAIMDWDEGQDLRSKLDGPALEKSLQEEEEVSDDLLRSRDGGGGGGGQMMATTPPRVTPSASAAQTPRGTHGLYNSNGDYNDEADGTPVDQGRSGVQPSVRSYARPASTANRSNNGHQQVPLSELPTSGAEYDVL